MKTLAIIGGGAAGFFAAINAAQAAQKNGISIAITIFEASGQYLRKVKISGGGRCNVTHHCFEPKTFCQNYPRGFRELLSPMQQFQAKDTVEWFAQAGINLVAEVDGRMFPESNNSETIINCYLDLATKLGVEVKTQHGIKTIEKTSSRQFKLSFNHQKSILADAVLIATGSSPHGYTLAESLGHTITERAPSLFSFKIHDPLIAGLQGLSFPHVQLKLSLPQKKIFKQQGPLLITHWGLSGPAILKLSAWAAREMKSANYRGILTIQWIPGKNSESLQRDLNQLQVQHSKSLLKNASPFELPKRFWLSLLNKNSIDPQKLWGGLSKKEIINLNQALSSSLLEISGQNRFKDEFVECGGVALPEINFKTMESKLCPKLYFAGEILDIDGITGGFNFQNAWTTGWIAAQNIIL